MPRKSLFYRAIPESWPTFEPSNFFALKISFLLRLLLPQTPLLSSLSLSTLCDSAEFRPLLPFYNPTKNHSSLADCLPHIHAARTRATSIDSSADRTEIHLVCHSRVRIKVEGSITAKEFRGKM